MTSTLGDRIRLIRKTNRLNQIEFSSMLGISQGTLSELEQDKYNPSLETILSIQKVFQTDLKWLLLGEIEQKDEGLFRASLNDQELKLFDLFGKLTDDDREEILQFIDLKVKRYKQYGE
jgi:transcriptional regulator with XRE-family HTH domain